MTKIHTMLAARSHFSIGESLMKPADIVAQAKALNQSAVALTDTMSITSMVDFSKAAQKAEIKAIIGCRLRLVENPHWRKTKEDKKAPPEYWVTAYALTEKGIEALYRLLTLAHAADRFYNSSKLSFDDLFTELTKLGAGHLAISTSDLNSVLQHPDHSKICAKIKMLVGDHFYPTLVSVNTPYWDQINMRAAVVAATVGGRLLTVRPVLYRQGQADATDIMAAICKNAKISEPWVTIPHARDMHALSALDLTKQAAQSIAHLELRHTVAAGSQFKAGLVNTDILVNSVTFKWKKLPPSLPVMAPDEQARLVELCLQGWKERFSKAVFAHQPTPEELKTTYQPRLKYELDTLRKLGFAGYFLLVHDVVSAAKTRGILVGPGRGSVGGSLVAYLCGITDCDPIRFGLLFERFINPDRIDLPDADLDFMSRRRHEVVEYITGRFGAQYVAGVSNFGTLAAASSIGQVGKCVGLSERDYACSRQTPKAHGQNIPLLKAKDMVAEIKTFSEAYPTIWETCVQVEGAMRNLGQHAAGFVVSGCKLVERAVIERRTGSPVVNWDKRIVEDQGLIKMDILGLQTLDLIDLSLEYIHARHPSKRVELLGIPLDDPKVLENFAAGKTVGVFQFESGGMRRLLKELGADGTISFDDITAATALYRPGPMESGMMDNYYKRKQGLETIEYDHPDMKQVLEPTFGVMVYQEQVMQVARTIAGYSAPDADKLRKIMGKKLPEEMAKERGRFVAGCVKTIGANERWAGALFDKIEGFAGYGFNKSHSVEYTLISYQSMWLKTYFPVEFFAAALSLMDDDKLPGLRADAERMGITIQLPHINNSTTRFEILNDNTLSIPFSRVKGISETAARHIVEVRKTARFTNKADFEARARGKMVHIGKIEALNKIGAFASIEAAQLPADHPDRIKDQRDLIPGLISTHVPVNREMNAHKAAKMEIARIVQEYRGVFGPAGKTDALPVSPVIGKEPRFMVIQDAPNKEEEKDGKITSSQAFAAISDALSQAGLNRNHGYWTALIKQPRKAKQVSPEEITRYGPYLQREMDVLKPPAIVLLGSQAVRHFFPDFKGKASDLAGQVIYHKALDANLVVGFSPGEIYYSPEKQVDMNAVFQAVAQLTS